MAESELGLARAIAAGAGTLMPRGGCQGRLAGHQ